MPSALCGDAATRSLSSKGSRLFVIGFPSKNYVSPGCEPDCMFILKSNPSLADIFLPIMKGHRCWRDVLLKF